MSISESKRAFVGACASLLCAGVLHPAALAWSEPCIPAGSTNAVEFDRPGLGASGDPVDAEWKNGSGDPEAWESDGGWSGDDYMGAGTPGDPPSSASVDVENKGGNLSGPNGDVQNGGVEGDCIEVYMCWTYRYKVKVKKCWKDAEGSDICVEYDVYKEGKKCSSTKEICPC